MVIQQDFEAEKDWHDNQFYIDSGHWTSHPIFASRERHWLFYTTEKIRFYGYLSKYISDKSYYQKAKILIAPIGNGHEVKYLRGLYKEIYGIDVSGKALSQCPRNIIIVEADILQSGFKDESFDVVICSFFLHHIHKVGFTRFIAEYYRILRRGGILIIHEPSLLFPPVHFVSILRKIIGNVTGLVKGERPIYPPRLTRALKEGGFVNIRTRGLSYSHVRYPIFVQLLISLLDWPCRVIWPFKLFSNGIGWYCEKPLK